MPAPRCIDGESPLRLIALVFTALLTACGGGGGVEQTDAHTRPSSVPGDVAPVVIAADASQVEAAAQRAKAATPEAKPPTFAEPPSSLAITTAGYHLVILNDGFVYRDRDELPAVHGSPYPTLRAVIFERALSRGGSRTLPVKPYCDSVMRCEFVPPRGAGIPDRFVLRLADDSVARLSVRDDAVVITPMQLEFRKTTTLRLFFEPAGAEQAIREIVYGQPQRSG
jgi:hypothetical protein